MGGAVPQPDEGGRLPSPGYVLTIGDIGVTGTQVFTPNGIAPLRGSQWIVIDETRTETKIPTWAIIVAILTSIFTCLLGLLFLLVKETRTTGYVNVNVRSASLVHTAQVPAAYPGVVDRIRASVNQAQAMAATAPYQP